METFVRKNILFLRMFSRDTYVSYYVTDDSNQKFYILLNYTLIQEMVCSLVSGKNPITYMR